MGRHAGEESLQPGTYTLAFCIGEGVPPGSATEGMHHSVEEGD